jgi:hypothetical protein
MSGIGLEREAERDSDIAAVDQDVGEWSHRADNWRT